MNATAYDPGNSKVSEETMDEWRERPLTGDLAEDRVPGIGAGTIAKLKEQAAYDTTYKLLGTFLGLMGNGEGVMETAGKFKEVLAEQDTPSQWQDTVVTAVVEKVMKGFRMGMEMSEDRLSSSRMKHDEMEEFLAKEFTGDLEKDFKGVSAASAKKLADNAGVETSWQFFGLACTSENATDFETTIKECGIAGGWSATVVHQVVEKMANGVKLPYS